MSKPFRAWDVDQEWLLPPSVHEFVPAGHLAHFVRDTVREALDLSAILDSYTEERGQRPALPARTRRALRIVSRSTQVAGAVASGRRSAPVLPSPPPIGPAWAGSG